MKIVKIRKCDAPRWNRKAYKFYILLPDNKIESGWENKEDAQDRLAEMKEDGIKAKAATLRTLQQMGIDPEDKAAWHAGDLNKFMKKGDADTSKEFHKRVQDIRIKLAKLLIELNGGAKLIYNAHQNDVNEDVKDELNFIIDYGNRIIKKAEAQRDSLDI